MKIVSECEHAFSGYFDLANDSCTMKINYFRGDLRISYQHDYSRYLVLKGFAVHETVGLPTYKQVCVGTKDRLDIG